MTSAASTLRNPARHYRTSALGEIHADTSYPLPVFLQKTGLQRKSFTRAKAEGLRIRRQGRRVYVLGKDWHEHLERTAGATR